MLVKLSVSNFKSFDQKEELVMISSSKIQKKRNHRVKIKQTNILKNAVIYGANASGKSNLVAVFSFIKSTLQEGLSVKGLNDFCRNREENRLRESEFEILFTVDDNFYAYGFTAILSQRKIKSEWLYRLTQNGNAHPLFERDGDDAPVLGENVRVSEAEQERFNIYAEDFAGHDTRLFLAEMNRGKKYSNDSGMHFFKDVYRWIMKNIIVITPRIGLTNVEAYYNDESLDRINRLIQTFDTGITDVQTKQVTIEEVDRILPPGMARSIVEEQLDHMQRHNLPNIQATLRFDRAFLNFRIDHNGEPSITTLALRHGNPLFDFTFSDESDGTRRLFDLIDMLLTDRPDTLFVVDELERSLHPKLTEHFLQLFMDAHDDARMQLIFTTHEDTIMDLELFRRDEIWFVERNKNNASDIYSLDRFKERYDTKLSKAYLEGRYGAIPVFKQFSFEEGES